MKWFEYTVMDGKGTIVALGTIRESEIIAGALRWTRAFTLIISPVDK